MKRIFITGCLILSVTLLFGQAFRQAIGLRAGLSPGFEYRIHTDESNSYKFLLSNRSDGIQLHGIKEFHRFNLFSFSDQIVFIYGLGIHAGYERYDVKRFHYNSQYYTKETAFLAGLDGLAGAEYTFLEIPISLGFEVKPFFDLFGEKLFRIQPFDFAFTVKYLF